MLPSHFNLLDFGVFATVVIFALFLAIVFLLGFSTKKRRTSLPGIDSTHPEKGNFEDMQDAGSLHEFLLSLHDKYGPLASFWWGAQLVVSIASPEMFDQVKALFDRPPMVFQSFEKLIGKKSIQYANGDEGRKRKQLMDQGLTHLAVSYYYEHFLKVSTDLCVKWKNQPSDEQIPLTQNMMGLSTKAVTISTLGSALTDEDISKIFKSYCAFMFEEEKKFKGDFPSNGDGREEKINKSINFLQSFVKRIINERCTLDKRPDHTLLDSLIDTDFIDEEELVNQCLTLLIGGFHTVGSTLSWCLYFLATHEDMQEKLHEEFVNVLGEEDITADVLPQLKYCRQVINETMRCCVLAPFAARYADDDVLIGEYIIPKQTPIILALGVVLKDKIIWPDPDRFDPDRFTEEKVKTRHPMAFQPFGFAGKRKCVGYRFAYAEMTVVLSVLLRQFKFYLVDGQVVEASYGIVSRPKDEVWITLSKR